jgi:hypothetical protein
VTITGFTDCVFTGTDDVQTIKELYPGKTATLKKDGFPDTGAHAFPAPFFELISFVFWLFWSMAALPVRMAADSSCWQGGGMGIVMIGGGSMDCDQWHFGTMDCDQWQCSGLEPVGRECQEDGRLWRRRGTHKSTSNQLKYYLGSLNTQNSTRCPKSGTHLRLNYPK